MQVIWQKETSLRLYIENNKIDVRSWQNVFIVFLKYIKEKEEYDYFQAQRYWVERTFDDSKNELGMSDYQVRKWTGWYHHTVLVIMAGLYLTQEKIANEKELPLMSTADARVLMIAYLFGTEEQQQMRIKQMVTRHKKRKKDIDRRYRYQEIEEQLL